MNLTAFIVDDNQASIDNLKSHLSVMYPDIEITGEARDCSNAIQQIAKLSPDLLFLDVEFGNNKICFDILNQVKYDKYKIIFVSAHNSFAVQAIKYSPIDYLLKPIDPNELKFAFEKAKSLMMANPVRDQVQENLKSVKNSVSAQRIFLKTQDSIIAVCKDDIVHIAADGSYSDIYLNNKKKITVSKNIKEFDELLSEYAFYRPHQSHLINMHYFDFFKKSNGGSIYMKDGSEIPVSTRKKQEFLEFLK